MSGRGSVAILAALPTPLGSIVALFIPTGVRRTARNTTDRHISHTRRTSGSRKCSHCSKTGVSASVSASRK
jgi:hypothetical protein